MKTGICFLCGRLFAPFANSATLQFLVLSATTVTNDNDKQG